MFDCNILVVRSLVKMEARQGFCLLLFALLMKKTLAFKITEEQFNFVLHKLSKLDKLEKAYDGIHEEIREIKDDLIMERTKNTELNKDLIGMKKETEACKIMESELEKIKAKGVNYNDSDLEERVVILELEVANLQVTLIEKRSKPRESTIMIVI